MAKVKRTRVAWTKAMHAELRKLRAAKNEIQQPSAAHS